MITCQLRKICWIFFDFMNGTDDVAHIALPFVCQVRQYSKDYSFYAKDVKKRGLCSDHTDPFFECKAFAPSSATVKVKTAEVDCLTHARLRYGGTKLAFFPP